jgi:hypothetical protein
MLITKITCLSYANGDITLLYIGFEKKKFNKFWRKFMSISVTFKLAKMICIVILAH